VRQLVQIVVADTHPIANLRVLQRVQEITGGSDEQKQHWGQQANRPPAAQRTAQHSTHRLTHCCSPLAAPVTAAHWITVGLKGQLLPARLLPQFAAAL
jgi:hypothetical protein